MITWLFRNITLMLLCTTLLGTFSTIYLFYKVLDYKGRLWTYKISSHPVYEGEIISRLSKNAHIWVIGDSRAEAWEKPANLGAYEWVKRGVSGYTSGETLTRLLGDLSKNQCPEWVVIQCGINDVQGCGYGQLNLSNVTEGVILNLEKMSDICLQDGSQVIVTTVIPKGSNTIRERALWSKEMLAAVAIINNRIRLMKKPGLFVIDLDPLIAAQGKTLDLYSKDGLHLNTAGYDMISASLVALFRLHEAAKN